MGREQTEYLNINVGISSPNTTNKKSIAFLEYKTNDETFNQFSNGCALEKDILKDTFKFSDYIVVEYFFCSNLFFCGFATNIKRIR